MLDHVCVCVCVCVQVLEKKQAMTEQMREKLVVEGGVAYIPGYTWPRSTILFDKICIIWVRLRYAAETISFPCTLSPQKGLRQHTMFGGCLNASPRGF